MGQPRKPIDTRRRKKQYTFEEDTHIVAQTAFYLVLSTREDVDPVPFIEAVLQGYAERVRTVHASAAPVVSEPPPAVTDPDRPVRARRVRRFSEE